MSNRENALLEYEKNSLQSYLELTKLTDVKPGDLVLDVGCGTCPLLNLKNRNYEIVGLDCDRDMLEIAKRKNRSSIIEADARYLPFRDNSFDAVIAASLPQDAFGDMLEYLDAVREMSRVLKPSRKIAILEDLFVVTGRMAEVESLLKRLGFYNLPKRIIGIVYGTKPEKLNEVPRAYSESLDEELYPK